MNEQKKKKRDTIIAIICASILGLLVIRGLISIPLALLEKNSRYSDAEDHLAAKNILENYYNYIYEGDYIYAEKTDINISKIGKTSIKGEITYLKKTKYIKLGEDATIIKDFTCTRPVENKYDCEVE